MSRKLIRLFSLSGIAITFTLLSSFSSAVAAANPVTVVNKNMPDPVFVAKNLPWSNTAKAEVSKATAYLKNQIQNELNSLKSAGATKVTRKYIATDSEAYPDWNDYVGHFDQYVLTGLNAKGKVVAQSQPLPFDLPDLASRLGQLKSTPCSISAKISQGLPTCEMASITPDIFLRAAFRTYKNNTENRDLAEALDYQKQLTVCLSNKFPYQVKNSTFICPRNKDIFTVESRFPTTKSYVGFSYSISIDTKTNKAVMTYRGKDLSKVAPKATYTDYSLMRFSY